MDVQEMVGQAREALTVRRVFGEAQERDGVTVIPAATVRGGAGGGGAPSKNGDGYEGGGGFGLTARPAGAYVIKDGRVAWQPAIDVNRAILGGQIVAVVFLLVWRSLAKSRSKRKVKLAKAQD